MLLSLVSKVIIKEFETTFSYRALRILIYKEETPEVTFTVEPVMWIDIPWALQDWFWKDGRIKDISEHF